MSAAGEKEGRREAMDKITARLVADGVRPDAATKQARESMLRVDRTLAKQGR